MVKHIAYYIALSGVVSFGVSAQGNSTEIFDAPKMSISPWNADTSTSVRLSIVDISDCETGYRIYRERDFSSTFTLIKELPSANPSHSGDTIRYKDTLISFNRWYRYRVDAYKNDSALASVPCTTFTLRYEPSYPRTAVRFTKLSDFFFTDLGEWSALAGDSIIYKDAAGRYAAINVKNPLTPAAAGYLDSVTLLSYPQETLIPAFLSLGVTNNYACAKVVKNALKNPSSIVIAQNNTVRTFIISENTLISRFWKTVDGTIEHLITLNDSLLGVLSFSGAVLNFNIYSLSAGGFVQCLNRLFTIHELLIHGGGRSKDVRPYFHSVKGQTAYISIDSLYYEGGTTVPSPGPNMFNTAYVSVSDVRGAMTNSVAIGMPFANAFNTGLAISQTQSLCTNGFPFYHNITDLISNVNNYNFKPGDVPTELFVADFDDPHPHATASALGAIYSDSVFRQNQLRNVLLDTLKKRVYLIWLKNMSILSYQHTKVETVPSSAKTQPSQGIELLNSSFSGGVTVILPRHQSSSKVDLCFYDLSGRIIDRIRGITVPTFFWKAPNRSHRCFILSVKTDGRTYVRKFTVR